MRPHVKEFVHLTRELMDCSGIVVEIGSRQIQKTSLSDLRLAFRGQPYIGLDILSGVGVDLMSDGERIALADERVDVVLILETLEHIKQPHLVIREIKRILSPGGIVLASSVGPGWPIHNYPSDYWRFTPAGFYLLFRIFQTYFIDWGGPEANPGTVVAVGVKGEVQKNRAKIFAGALWGLLPKVFGQIYSSKEDYRSKVEYDVYFP